MAQEVPKMAQEVLKEVLQEESPKRPKSLMMSFKFLQKNSICASVALRRPGTTQVPPTVAPISPERLPRWMTDGLRGSQKGPKKAAQCGPRGYQDAQDGLQDGPEAPPEAPKTASDGPGKP